MRGPGGVRGNHFNRIVQRLFLSTFRRPDKIIVLQILKITV